MVTRSKASWAAKNKRTSDTTYHGIINFHDNMEAVLHSTLHHYGQLKAADLATTQAHYNAHRELPTREERTKPLQTKGIPANIARAIVEKNTTLIENAAEAATANIAKWETERDTAPPRRKNKYQAKIDKAQRVSICLGSKNLFKQAQKDPTGTLMNEWRDRRLFFECPGDTGRISGNRQARLTHLKDDIFTLTMTIFNPEENTYSWQEIGTVHYKRGTKALRNAIDARAPISMRIVKKGRHYTVYATPSVDPIALQEFTPKGNNHAGFDLNDHHYDYTITDPTANPLGRETVTFQHAGEEMDTIVAATFKELYERGVKSVSIERLSGINRAKSARETGHAAPGVRRAANQLPVRLFFEAVRRNARKYGMELSIVNPAGTSRDTKFWSEPLFGEDTHQKASYLVARRGLGLSLVGRREPSVSGRRRMSISAGLRGENGEVSGVSTVVGHVGLMGEVDSVALIDDSDHRSSSTFSPRSGS